jgi:hypothetical protein
MRLAVIRGTAAIRGVMRISLHSALLLVTRCSHGFQCGKYTNVRVAGVKLEPDTRYAEPVHAAVPKSIEPKYPNS